MDSAFRFLLLPAALVLAGVLTLASYLAYPTRRLRWLSIVRLWLLASAAVLLLIPSWIQKSRDVDRPRLAVLLDESLSMRIAETEGSRSRWERALDRYEAIRKQFSEDFDIDLYGFSRDAVLRPEIASGASSPFAPTPRQARGRGKGVDRREGPALAKETSKEGLAKRAEGPAADGKGSPLLPPGTETRLARALATAIDRQDKQLTRGIFVLSDGRSTSGETPLPWARTSPIPIFPMAVGSDSFAYSDLEVSSVEAPDHLFRDSIGRVDVRVSARGLPGGVVTLEQGGRRIDQKPFTARDAGPVSFELKPAGGGLTLYEVRVDPVEGELTDLNNSRSFPILIETTPRKVLLLAARPSWDYTFLRRQLRADPRYEVTDPMVFGSEEAIPLPPEGLSGFGLVVVNGFRKSAFPAPAIQALRRYVERSDGVLVFTGNGRDSLDALMASDLDDLLPVTTVEGFDSVPVRLPFLPSGQSPIFRILEHPQANDQAWRGLPPILAAQPDLMASPSARVLGSFPRYPKDAPAICYRLFGRGMTVLFNTDETYLWKLMMEAVNDPDRLHERFWANLLSWLTDEARLTGVALTLSRLHFTLGDEVFVRIDDYTGRLQGLKAEEILLDYEGEGGSSGRMAPEQVAGGWLASFVPAEEGRFAIELTLPDGSEVRKEILVDAVIRDFTDPLADLSTLQQMAELSGGRFFAEGAGGLESLKLDPTPRVNERVESLYWLDRYWALMLVLGLMIVEWLMRKRNNLV